MCDYVGVPPKPWPVIPGAFVIRLDGVERVDPSGIPRALTPDEAKEVLRRLGHDKE